MNNEKFKTMYEKIAESYTLDIGLAKKLLQKILEVLYGKSTDTETDSVKECICQKEENK